MSAAPQASKLNKWRGVLLEEIQHTSVNGSVYPKLYNINETMKVINIIKAKIPKTCKARKLTHKYSIKGQL